MVPSRTPTVLLDGLAMVESARWHDGRLWFAHWGTGEIVAVGADGTAEVVGHGPPGLGWSIDWLPDGRLLVTGPELTRREPDGSTVRHADLRALSPHGWNEIVVDGRGNAYVDSVGFAFGAEEPRDGLIALVTPDGSARVVVTGLAFPNGMAITPDGSTLIVAESFAGRLTAFDIGPDGGLSHRRVWADGLGPDGICVDAEGAVWAQSADTFTHTGRAGAPAGECVRVREGGGIVDRVAVDQPVFACALGGPDRRTLFLLCADWRGIEQVDEVIAARTGRVLTVDAPAPGAGRP
jgi:sugar lactone lactonase YvrE